MRQFRTAEDRHCQWCRQPMYLEIDPRRLYCCDQCKARARNMKQLNPFNKAKRTLPDLQPAKWMAEKNAEQIIRGQLFIDQYNDNKKAAS